MLLGAIAPVAAVPVPIFENDLEIRTESGYIKLSWEWDASGLNPETYTFELQQADNPAFGTAQTIYHGPDYATFLSGLRDGNYYYRLRACREQEAGVDYSGWSDSIHLEVKHHSLQLAFTLFAIGAIVFLLTVGIVIRGARMATAQKH